jgi:uncharacterized protein
VYFFQVAITLDDLRRFAVSQSLFTPTSLRRAFQRLGFVQADPIRAPARAQDLTLRHRVKDYRAGDLDRQYAKIGVAEDFFLNYGFVTAPIQALMHPRTETTVPAEGPRPWPAERKKQARRVLEFVQERGEVHPREVEDHFAQGTVTNYWGGASNATTHLMDAMLYRGMLRVTRREGGIRIFTAHQHGPGPADAAARAARVDTLVDAAVRIYAPLASRRLSFLVRRLRFAVPQWQGELTGALQRARQRLSHARVDGIEWYWPAEEDPKDRPCTDTVRLLAPFDPVVWDRDRFELLWGWVYRFEAYTPASRRKLGYYALPLLWRERVIGWANLSVKNGGLETELGYVDTPPRQRAFRHALAEEIDRMRFFLDL